MKADTNIVIDRAIYTLQRQGGISRLWRELEPRLRAALPDATFDDACPPDVFLPTYYDSAPPGARSIAIVYDWIAEKHPLIGRHHPDAIMKRRAVAEASAVIAISPGVATDTERFAGRTATVAECGGGETLQRPLPFAVDDFKARYGLDKPYVVIVGRRGLYKNTQVVYQAWGQWLQHPNYTLLCVGGEDSLPEDRAFDRAYPGVRRQVNLTDSDLAAAYAGTSALVYPSMYEGFGLPVVEAMACGCPIIGGEAIRPVADKAGFYADVFRPRGIAAALDLTLDPALRLEHVLAGYERAKLYTWDRMAAKVAEVIRSVA